eukprot:GHVN01003570.1.p1 GENE.GHVN01003570.1~~GHVN01003570.1.p1  ORF type:complete len:902 (-),score=75.11 GHVN01003570.1:4353-7058(-)
MDGVEMHSHDMASIDQTLQSLLEAAPEEAVDMLWLHACLAHTEEERNLVVSITNTLLDDEALPTRSLILSMPPWLLEAVGLIESAELFKRTLVRMNTAQSYKQQKFNLFIEEPIGYSRMLECLSTPQVDGQTLYRNLCMIIGEYALDLCRVLYSLLEFINPREPEAPALECLSLFRAPDKIAALLGLKAGQGDVYKAHELWIFLKEKQILREKDRACLFENECEIQRCIDIYFHGVSFAARKRTALFSDMKEADESPLETLSAHMAHSLPGLFLLDLLTQKSPQAVDVLTKHPLLVRTHTDYMQGLAVYLEQSADDIQAALQEGNADAVETTLPAFSNSLSLLGFGLSFRPALFVVVCDIVRALLLSEHLQAVGFHLILNSVLPACFFLEPEESSSAWGALSSLSISKRFSVYKTIQESAREIPEAALLFCKCENKTKAIMKRLTTENTKDTFEKLLLLSSVPFPVVPVILNLCKAFPNTIPPTIASLSSMPAFFLDVFFFCLFDSLLRDRSPLPEDNAFFSDHFYALSTLAAEMCLSSSVSQAVFSFFLDSLEHNPFLFLSFSIMFEKKPLPGAFISFLEESGFQQRLVLLLSKTQNTLLSAPGVKHTKQLSYLLELSQNTLSNILSFLERHPPKDHGSYLPSIESMIQANIAPETILLFHQRLFTFNQAALMRMVEHLFAQANHSEAQNIFPLAKATLSLSKNQKLALHGRRLLSAGEIGLFFRACLLPRMLTASYYAFQAAEIYLDLISMHRGRIAQIDILDIPLSQIYRILCGSTEHEVKIYGKFISRILSWTRPSTHTEKTILPQISRLLLSEEYTENRNSIVFLEETASIFPFDEECRRALFGILNRKKEREEREDMKLMLMQYENRLSAKRKASEELGSEKRRRAPDSGRGYCQ